MPKSGSLDVELVHRGVAKYAALFEHGVYEQVQRTASHTDPAHPDAIATSTQRTPGTPGNAPSASASETATASAQIGHGHSGEFAQRTQNAAAETRTSPHDALSHTSMPALFDHIERVYAPLNTALSNLQALANITSVRFHVLSCFSPPKLTFL